MDEIQLDHSFVPNVEGDIHVMSTKFGHKETCVFVHGFMGNGYWWYWLMPYLVEKYNLIIIDLPGMGQSKDRLSYSISAMGSAIIEVIRHFEVNLKVHLIGHSFGALASGHALIQSPNNIKSFHCIDMDLIHLQDESHPKMNTAPRRYHANKETLMARFRLVPAETLCSKEAFHFLAQNSIHLFDQGWAWSFDPNILNTKKDNVLSAFKETVKTHHIPTQLVLGDKTTVLNLDKATNHWQLIMGNKQIKVMPGYHHLMLDDPKALTLIIHQFVSDLNE